MPQYMIQCGFGLEHRRLKYSQQGFGVLKSQEPSGKVSLTNILGSNRETPEKGPFLNPAYGSLERDLMERVHIPKGPPNPNSYNRY